MGQDPSDIREEIEHTRAEMGDTVDALAHKADVKSRVKESFADKKERMKTQMQGTTSRLGDATPDSGQVKDGAKQAVGIAEENPIGLALGGVAVGFIAGMLLPSTRMGTKGSGRSPKTSRKRRSKPDRRRSSAARTSPARWPSGLPRPPRMPARSRPSR
jgi:ElaB/YqjD/DUF883 family membrane-anchored ribosome-binding protein